MAEDRFQWRPVVSRRGFRNSSAFLDCFVTHSTDIFVYLQAGRTEFDPRCTQGFFFSLPNPHRLSSFLSKEPYVINTEAEATGA